jgi:hypothetical protein
MRDAMTWHDRSKTMPVEDLRAENMALKTQIVDLTRRLETERQMRAWLDRGGQQDQLMVKLLKTQQVSRNRHRQIRKLKLELAKAKERASEADFLQAMVNSSEKAVKDLQAELRSQPGASEVASYRLRAEEAEEKVKQEAERQALIWQKSVETWKERYERVSTELMRAEAQLEKHTAYGCMRV